MEDIVSHRQIDCVPGNLCVGNHPGYTKCLADTDTSTYWGSQSNIDISCRIGDRSALMTLSAAIQAQSAEVVSYRVCQQLNYMSGLCLNLSGFSLVSPTLATSANPLRVATMPSYSHSKLLENVCTFKYSFWLSVLCPSYIVSIIPSFSPSTMTPLTLWTINRSSNRPASIFPLSFPSR